MDTSERSRKKREVLGAREEPGSIPPPARRKRERHELDPENRWDSGAEEATDDEDAETEDEDDDFNEDAAEEASGEDLDDWDHPVRRLKIN